ncbi:CpaF family protein [Tepidibacillus infernus]|uniref:Type II secretion system protein E n=1 Tax=Tepidibacillus decaturensis TaxID=1413211 RepID=A0A135L692_9BACI|nr:CpaF family protein [Tepidibacillus decaturensis]KXG44486.1 type II secretion system protein E [Tepidibacillus decaturensis]
MSLLQRLQGEQRKDGIQQLKKQHSTSEVILQEDPYAELKSTIHQKILEEFGKESLDDDSSTEEWDKIKQLIEKILQESEEPLTRQQRETICQEMIAEMKGFGPIDPLLHDDEVSEIMVNHAKQVYVERKGRLERVPVQFRDDAHVMRIIEKIVSPLGRRIDESSPMVDARLPDGSRVNAIIPPLAIKGPSITIRKFAKDPFQIEDLIGFGTLTEPMARFLEAAVKARLNIVVSGGTGSGKTTTLNVLSSFIPADERIVTIEDAAELQLRQDHVITLETRPPNIEGKGAITMRDLVKNSLRMRPDRIVVGEVRSGEALDMLQAMNTGHDGSLTTGHANTPRDMLSRLETMVLMAGMDLPVRAIREQIASAIDLIVQQNRLKDGSRKITQITEVLGMEGDVITMQDIFVYKQQGKDINGKVVGSFQPTGIVPKCFESIQTSGIPITTDLFQR